MKVAGVFVLILLVALAAISCRGPAAAPEPINLVPADANLVALVQIAEFREEPALQRMLQTVTQIGPAIRGRDGCEDVVPDWRRFDQVLFFADPARPEGYAASIVNGPVNPETLLAEVSAATGIEPQGKEFAVAGEFQETVYVVGCAGRSLNIAFLGEKFTVMGDWPAVKDVIRVYHGNGEPLGGPVLDAFDRTGESAISMALDPTREVLAQSQGILGEFALGGFASVTETFQDVAVITAVINPAGEGVTIEAGLHFDSEESADAFGKTLDGLLKLAAGFTPDEKFRDLVSKVGVTVAGDRVTITLSLTGAELLGLMEEMTGG